MEPVHSISVCFDENPTPTSFKENFEISAELYTEFQKNQSSGYGIVPMLACVIRTDTLENIATDLFLPTLIHVACKAKTLGQKIILTIGACLADLLTLPIRLATLIPRVAIGLIYSKSSHPAYRFFEQHSSMPHLYEKANPIYLTHKMINGRSISASAKPYYFTPVPEPIDAGLKFF